MTHQIKWKFEGLGLTFVSNHDKLAQDQTRWAAKFQTQNQIVILDDQFTRNTSPDGCASCKRHTAVDPQPTLPVGAKKGKPKPQAPELLGVFIDVDPASTADTLLSDAIPPSDAHSPFNGLDGQPVG